ncbi:hypothetical protein K3727_06490 [Rhodobacteraceae bacterium M382]|nr:hypothetical protein K3727_06490 [Rhodobacteraceae bacterium M382]
MPITESTQRILGEVGEPQLIANTIARSQPINLKVTGLSDGGFVAIWQESDVNTNAAIGTTTNAEINDLFAQRYDAYGTAVGSAFSLETTAGTWPGQHHTIPLADGGFTVVFERLESTGTFPNPPVRGVQHNTYNDMGDLVASVDLPIPSGLSGLTGLSLIDSVRLSDGKIGLLYSASNPDSISLNLVIQDTTNPDALVEPRELTSSSLASATLVESADGGFVLVMAQFTDDGGSTRILSQRFDASGTAVDLLPVTILTTPHYLNEVVATGLDGGDLQLSWAQGVGTIYNDAFNGDIMSLRITSSGEIVGEGPTVINTTRDGNQIFPAVTGLGVDGHAITWRSVDASATGADAEKLYLQNFDATGAPTGGEILVPEPDHADFATRNLGGLMVAPLADGGVIVSWGVYETREIDSASHDSVVFNDHVFHRFNAFYDLPGTPADDVVTGSEFDDAISGFAGNDRLVGLEGDDFINGQAGADTLNGGEGHDTLLGGLSPEDLRDIIYAGDGNDSVDAGAGNDLVFGQDGDDTIAGGAGVDELQGQNGNDVITGSAFSDLVFGGAGNDFVNGGFGHDRINGGSGADKFFHAGVLGHGSDWVQDYVAADGDVLLWGSGPATASDFQVNLAHTANAAGERSGDDAVQEAFVIYKPTEQIIWALVDGGGQSSINLQIDGDVFDLLA